MKNYLSFLFSLFIFSSLHAQNIQDSYSSQWRKVYKHELNELPKSAAAIVDSIYLQAKKEENSPQLVKALLYQSKFMLMLQEDAQLAVVTRFKEEISANSFPTRNLLENVLANIYWQYYTRNRWQIQQRTRSKEKVNKLDFRTWDPETLFAEIHHHFQNSLLQEKELQKAGLQAFNDILQEASESKKMRPSLFDFLAHNALAFYQSNETGITQPSYKFEIDDPRYFTHFSELKLHSKDSLSLPYQALQIYQKLLHFHAQDKDPTALLTADLERLEFIRKNAILPDKEELYFKVLERLKEQYREHPLAATVAFKMATFHHELAEYYRPKVNEVHRFKNKDALQLCAEAISRFPESVGAENCAILQEKIKQEKLEITAEKYISIGLPSRLLLRYKNLDSLHFTIYRTSAEEEKQFYKLPNDSARRAFSMALPLEKKWLSRLRNEEDYQFHTTEILVPALGQGHFLMVASPSDKTIQPDEIYGFSFFQVTNLALVQNIVGGLQSFQVLDRNTGKPLKGASVRLNNRDSDRRYNGFFDRNFETDKNGQFSIASKQYFNGLSAKVSYGEDQAVFEHYYLSESREQGKETKKKIVVKPFLFTDRSIYRPGQTVFFKGILIKKQGESSALVPKQSVEVLLENVNGEEIEVLYLQTNEYGSFSGEFKLPAGGLTGAYTIVVDQGPEDSPFNDAVMDDFDYGEHVIQVEDYKRPKFEVAFKAVSESYRLNDTISLSGSAQAFAGSKITDAKVVYRVKRKVQFPNWYNRSYSYPYYSTANLEITHGETTTNSEGVFNIDFKAIPDLKVPKEGLPVFQYEITADITDVNGETRSASTLVKVGYHSLLATIQAPDKIDKRSPEQRFSLRTQNLNGEFVAAKGSLKIYKLQAPGNVLRKRPWSAPDYQTFSKAEFNALFPHDAYENEDEPKNRKKGKLLWEADFDTGQSKDIDLLIQDHWEQGAYVMELESRDAFGQQVIDKHGFSLFSSKDPKPADNELFSIKSDKSVYKQGDKVLLEFGTASKELIVTLYIENMDGRIRKVMVVPLSNEVKELKIPVSRQDIGGFAIHYSFAAYNSFKHGFYNIWVSNPKEEIAIETLSFRDKMQPGEGQTWSFKVKGANGDKVAAEMLAGMYDASLDQFKKHHWDISPIRIGRFYSSFHSNADHSFGSKGFSIMNSPYYRYYFSQPQYDQLNWFGFSLEAHPYIKNKYLREMASAFYSSSIQSGKDAGRTKGYVYGTIRDEEDQPLPGVNVLVLGSKNRAVTDLEGNYEIKAAEGDKLIFSFIGMQTISTTLGNTNIIDVSMVADVKALGEVVVVGYATQSKKNVTGAISSVADEEVAFEMALQGRAAGVEVSYHPKNEALVKIRGQSSLEANERALYVVDGVLVDAFDLSQEEVLAMEVLKGNAATAIYGARAAIGVVIISTKEGQKQLDAMLSQVKARENLQETAFFYPHLSTDKKGVISFNFNAPEALTRWKLQLLTHTKTLGTATKTLQAVTQQELMVMPNPPRFLREGDEIVFSSKISNLSADAQHGYVALQLFDAISGMQVDESFENTVKNKPFTVNAKGNTQVSWKLKVPTGIQALQYKIVAKAGGFSDGEQNVIPVLPNRMLLTETLPIWARAHQSKTFSLEKLKNQSSATLQHHSLTLEMTSNPAWYALQALPYLMEYPYGCAEQTFARYYANALAGQMLKAHPRLKALIDQWASGGVLLSNLEKNEELKSLIIQETPWLRDAQSESEQKKRLALLFDLNKMEDEGALSLAKLQDMQMAGGGFPWFKGSRYPNRFISQHIATGFAQLKHLGVSEEEKVAALLETTFRYLDAEIVADYQRLLEHARHQKKEEANKVPVSTGVNDFLEQNHLRPIQIQYLYMNSLYPERKITPEVQAAIHYFHTLAIRYWKEESLYMKGMIALLLHRKQEKAVPQAILASLKEYSISSEEMGMYWKENKAGWHWHQSTIETQALLIEAFSEIGIQAYSPDDRSQMIDDMKVWLMKHKQTKQWPSTKATTQAVYALLMNGSNWMAMTELADVSVGGKLIDPFSQADAKAEAGTGYFKTSWKGSEITPDMHELKVQPKGNEMVWGGLYWQYFEDLDKITPAATPLQLRKEIFLKINTDSGEELVGIDAERSLKVGDLLRVRIELKVDRDMDFVHMKDMRASGLEPINVLSAYKWQDGLGYYESTRDASTNFFFEHLSKGVYVFEYDLRVNNRGDFSNGISSIQSMYAPEFSSHSKGIRVQVKE